LDRAHGGAKLRPDFFAWDTSPAELGRPIAHIARSSEHRPDVVLQVSRDVQRQRPGRARHTGDGLPDRRLVGKEPDLTIERVQLTDDYAGEVLHHAAIICVLPGRRGFVNCQFPTPNSHPQRPTANAQGDIGNWEFGIWLGSWALAVGS